MKTKFYPGPLVVRDRNVISEKNNRIVAECGQSTSVEMDIATARLFAAAPDLYRDAVALLDVADGLSEMPPELYGKLIADFLTQLSKSVQKAETGEE